MSLVREISEYVGRLKKKEGSVARLLIRARDALKDQNVGFLITPPVSDDPKQTLRWLQAQHSFYDRRGVRGNANVYGIVAEQFRVALDKIQRMEAEENEAALLGTEEKEQNTAAIISLENYFVENDISFGESSLPNHIELVIKILNERPGAVDTKRVTALENVLKRLVTHLTKQKDIPLTQAQMKDLNAAIETARKLVLPKKPKEKLKEQEKKGSEESESGSDSE